MGLDMYAYGTQSENSIDHFTVLDPDALVAIHKWRKHPALHGWMERLWAKRCAEVGMAEKTKMLPPYDVEKHIGKSIRLHVTDPSKKGAKPPTLSELRKNHPEMVESIIKEFSKPNSPFNREAIRITAEELDQLEADIKAAALPHTDGPFFGDCEQNEETKADDLAFVAKARKLISAGFAVYYRADW